MLDVNDERALHQRKKIFHVVPVTVPLYGIYRRLDGDAFADQIFPGDDQFARLREAFHHLHPILGASPSSTGTLMGLPILTT